MLRWIAIVGLLLLLTGCQQCTDPTPDTTQTPQGDADSKALPAGPGERILQEQGKVLSETEREKAERAKARVDAGWRKWQDSFDGATYVGSTGDPEKIHAVITRFAKIKARMPQLADLLEKNAQQVRQTLRRDLRYVDLTAPLAVFDQLHALHAKALKNGDILIAHNIWRDIERFGFNICGDQSKLRRLYELPEVKTIPGPTFCRADRVLCGYVGGAPDCDPAMREWLLKKYDDPIQSVALYEALLQRIDTSPKQMEGTAQP